MGEIRNLAGPDVILVGNIPPLDVMATGSSDDVDSAVKKAINEVDDHDRIVWSVGGGMPPDVSNDNINAFLQAVKKYAF